MRNDAEIRTKISDLELEISFIKDELDNKFTDDDTFREIAKCRNMEIFVHLLKIYLKNKEVTKLFMEWMMKGMYNGV